MFPCFRFLFRQPWKDVAFKFMTKIKSVKERIVKLHFATATSMMTPEAPLTRGAPGAEIRRLPERKSDLPSVDGHSPCRLAVPPVQLVAGLGPHMEFCSTDD